MDRRRTAALAWAPGRHPGDVCTYPDSDKTNFRGVAIGVWPGRAEPAAGLASAPDTHRRPELAEREEIRATALGQIGRLGPLKYFAGEIDPSET